MVSDFHHLWSRGEVVIFREKDDYRYFLNHLSSALSSLNIKCLAYAIMSTHIHLIIKTLDEEAIKQLITTLTKVYSIHFRKKYNESIPKGCFDMQYSDEKLRFEGEKTQVLYVVKNPVHHFSKVSPLCYDFSSAKYIFLEEILGEFEYQRFVGSLISVKELPKRHVINLVGEKGVPEDYLYDKISDMISPLSIIDVEEVKAYWGEYFRNFLYDMNSLPKDASSENIQEKELEMQCKKLNDIEVCELISEYVKKWNVGTFTKFSAAQKEMLTKIFLNQSIPAAQIKRCLW